MVSLPSPKSLETGAKVLVVREVYQGLDAVLPLREIEINLPLAENYEGVEFILEREDNEAN